MLLMAGIGVLRGMQWSLNFLLATGGVTMLVALGRPLYRVAVYRIGAVTSSSSWAAAGTAEWPLALSIQAVVA